MKIYEKRETGKSLRMSIFPLLTILMLAFNSYADHYLGSDLSYKHLHGNTYEITYNVYEECNGGGFSNTDYINVNLYLRSSCDQIHTNLFKIGEREELTPICDLTNSTCGSGGIILGIARTQYVAQVQLTPCSNWQIYANSSFRSDVISNLNPDFLNSAEDGQFLVTLATLNNEFEHNSSNEYNSLPIIYDCLDTPINYAHGTNNPDGDNTNFRMNVPLSGMGFNIFPIVFGGGYTPIAPIDGSLNLDPLTGELSINPTLQQTSVFVVESEEYRMVNGVYTRVGSTSRNMALITTANCSLLQAQKPEIISSNGCRGNVKLRTLPNDISRYTYQWLRDGIAINGATQVSYVPDLAGCYTVRITDANFGCSSESNPSCLNDLTPTLPAAGIEIINRSNHVCGELYDLFGVVNNLELNDCQISAVSWDFGDGTTASGSLNVSHAFSPGTWLVRFSYTDCCGDIISTSIQITVNRKVNSLYIQGANEICKGETTELCAYTVVPLPVGTQVNYYDQFGLVYSTTVSAVGEIPCYEGATKGQYTFDYVTPAGCILASSTFHVKEVAKNCCKRTILSVSDANVSGELVRINANSLNLLGSGTVCNTLPLVPSIKKGSSTIDFGGRNYYFVENGEIHKYDTWDCTQISKAIPNGVDLGELEYDLNNGQPKIWGLVNEQFGASIYGFDASTLDLEDDYYLTDNMNNYNDGSSTFDFKSRVMYVSAGEFFGFSVPTQLVRINIPTLSTDFSGPFPPPAYFNITLLPLDRPLPPLCPGLCFGEPQIYELEVSNNGSLYGIINTDFGTSWALIKVDPSTGSWYTIQNGLPLGAYADFVGTSTYNAETDVYYVSSGNRMLAIQCATGGYVSKTVDIRLELEMTGCYNPAKSKVKSVDESNNNKIEMVSESKQTISIHPNPSSTGLFNLDHVTPGSQLVVTDIYGKTVQRMTFDNPTGILNISEQPNGIYLVRVVSENKELSVIRLIKN